MINHLCRGQRQGIRPVRYKRFPISANPSRPLYFQSTKRLTAYQLHGSFTPGRFSAGCPHWLRRFYHARPVTEQEYHCPYCLSSPYREPPDIGSRLFIAPCRTVCSADHGEAANVAHAFATTIGMCLMKWYSVVKERAYSPHKRGKQAKSFYPSTCFLTKSL